MPYERALTQRELARYELARGNHLLGLALWREVRAVFTRLGMTSDLGQMDGQSSEQEQ